MAAAEAELPLHDVLIATHDAPFGFIVDFPKVNLAHVDDEPVHPNTAVLRTAAWRVLAAISGQCDHRVASRLSRDESCRWGQMVARGPQAFAAACLERTGVRFHEGAFLWEMNDLARVMADACGYNFIKLFAHMEQIRLDEPGTFPDPHYVPLFSEGNGHA